MCVCIYTISISTLLSRLRLLSYPYFSPLPTRLWMLPLVLISSIYSRDGFSLLLNATFFFSYYANLYLHHLNHILAILLLVLNSELSLQPHSPLSFYHKLQPNSSPCGVSSAAKMVPSNWPQKMDEQYCVLQICKV